MAYSTDPYLEALLQRRTGYAGVPTVSGVTPYNEGGALTSQDMPPAGEKQWNPMQGLDPYSTDPLMPAGTGVMASGQQPVMTAGTGVMRDGLRPPDPEPKGGVYQGDDKWTMMGMSAGNDFKDMSGYADINNNLAGLRAMGVPFDPYQRERQPIQMSGALNNYMGGLLF